MGGKAQRTNVAAGMSGSPVYVNGKLIGAVSLRMAQFSPDAICGITPIELMLEINANDTSRPTARDARPGKPVSRDTGRRARGSIRWRRWCRSNRRWCSPGCNRKRCAISARYSSSWVSARCRASGSVSTHGSKPAAGWENSLNPGDAVAGVLVDGDMGMSAFGTVTYNDGKRVLAFGHPLFNLGPVDMPMAKSEVVTDAGQPVPAEQNGERHGGRGRAAAGPAQRHHGRTRRHVADDSCDA